MSRSSGFLPRSRIVLLQAGWRFFLATILLASTFISAFLNPQPIAAAAPAGYSEYYIPGGTDQIFKTFQYIDNDSELGNAFGVGTCATGTNECNEMHNLTGLAVTTDNTTIYYDHWENGYLDGAAGDEVYVANKGAVLTWESSDIIVPRLAGNTCTSNFPAGGSPGGSATRCYDGRDRIYVVGGTVNVSNVNWPETVDTVFANDWEVYPIKPYLTNYVIPVGVDLAGAPNNYEDFNKAMILVQATQDNTRVTIDDPQVPGPQVEVDLDRGEVTQYNNGGAGANAYTSVTGSNPIQVQFVVGQAHAGVYSESRGFTAVPTGLWDTRYYSPYPSFTPTDGGEYTNLYIYNPSTSALTINWQESSASGSFSVPAQSTRSYYSLRGNWVPQNSGVYLEAADGVTNFWVIGAGGTENTTALANSNYDIGFSLAPAKYLLDDYTLGWAPEQYGTDTGTGNGSPIFITATENDTTIFVDFDPAASDGPEATYTIDRLQVLRIFDPDEDNTGTRVYGSAPFALVWGEDPDTCGISTPYLDVGSSILPTPEEWIDPVLTVSKSANPTTLPTSSGQTSTFTLIVDTSAYSVDDVTVVDTLPTNWSYVAGSTTITLPNGSTITGNDATPSISGRTLTWDDFSAADPPNFDPLDMSSFQTLMIVFEGSTTAAFEPGSFSINEVTTRGTRGGQIFNARDDAKVFFSDLTVTKTANPAGAVNPGASIEYTIVINNGGSQRQDNLVVTDPLPVGTTYSAGTAQVTRPLVAGWVGDDFSSQAYNGNDDSGAGDPSWNPAPGTWNEMGETTNATSGDMQVINDAVEGNSGNYELRIQGDGTTANGVNRDVDISSCTTAFLSLKYRRDSLDGPADYVRLSIRTGTNPFTAHYDFAGATGGSTDPAYKSYSVDISGYLASDTEIQLQGPTTLAADDRVWFNDVLIECFNGTTSSAGGAPPNLVTAANGYDLNAGQSMTVVYSVVVDNPVPSGLVNVVNTVAVTTDELPAPTKKTVINSVNTTSLAVIGNSVWLDENGDGYRDAGEAGITNVTVELWNAGHTAIVATTITDADGNYIFKNVAPGTYQVDVLDSSLPTGLVQTTVIGGSADNTNKADPYTLTVTAGSEAMQADFGYNWAPSSDTDGNTGSGAIGDRLWIDDGDGIQEPGEPGLGSVSVQLLTSGADGIFGTTDDVVAGTTTSAADGSYIFDGLTAGAYVVRVNGGAAPTGYTQTGDPDDPGAACTTCDNRTTTPILLAPGDVYVNADFGYTPTGDSGNIGDTLWLDGNRDDSVDAGEPRLAGVTVALIRDLNGDGDWDAGEPIIASDVTDYDGQYLFTNVPGSGTEDYLVWVNDAENVLAGLVPTYDSNGAGTPNLSAVTDLTSAGDLNQDFAYAPAGHASGEGLIGDTIFYDRDADGTFDLGEGLEGVKVSLYTADGINLIAETYTDENGQYAFGSLPAGSYMVRVDPATLPSGASNTVDPDGGVNNESVVTLGAGQVRLDQDFGYRDVSNPNTISGTLWRDTDADGLLDVGETGRFQNITILLRGSNSNIIATTLTNGSGDYSFTNLPDGTYRVDVSDDANLLDGYWHSLGTAGSDDNSQVDPYTVTVSGGTTDTTADFGYYRDPAEIGDFVWSDTNRDGIQDAGEPGMAGITVTLTVAWPGGAITTTITTTTDANGIYSFGNLLLDEDFDGAGAGEPTFQITIYPPSSYIATLTDQGGDDSLDSDGASIAAAPQEGTTNSSYDCGLVSSGVIGNWVWLDEDGDGYQDAGEGGISFVTVNLCSALPCSGGNVVAFTETDTDGYYSFGGLSDSTYFVQVDTGDPDFLAGLSQTFDPDGTLDDTARNIVISGGSVISIGGTSCSDCDLDIDFGYRPNSLSGTLWGDEDQGGHTGGAGDIDGWEITRYAGITVTLWTCGSGTCSDGDETLAGTTTTSVSGHYSFTLLANGTYAVVVDDSDPGLAGLTPTTPTSYNDSGDPWVVLSGGSSEVRDFGFYYTMDFGDLPSSYAITLMEDDGARHSILGSGAVYLGGSAPDGDLDGQESPLANGDDSDGSDDEDGVVGTTGVNWTQGNDGGSVDVTVGGCSGTCYLSAWIDWSRDNDFSDAGERVLLDYPVTNGSQTILIDVPVSPFNSTFNMRFRLYAGSTGGWAQPTGLAFNGEVEDYQWRFGPTVVTLSGFAARSGTGQEVKWFELALGLLLSLLGLALLVWQKRRTSA